MAIYNISDEDIEIIRLCLENIYTVKRNATIKINSDRINIIKIILDKIEINKEI